MEVVVGVEILREHLEVVAQMEILGSFQVVCTSPRGTWDELVEDRPCGVDLEPIPLEWSLVDSGPP